MTSSEEDLFDIMTSNITNATFPSAPSSAALFRDNVLRVCYVMGILGNLLALVGLYFGERKIRNRKHSLLLKSLAWNDFVAVIGMMAAMVVQGQMPWVNSTRFFCGVRVFMRIFGIGSVCIAVVMALERCLALTQPFLYQKHITYHLIRRTLIGSWLWAAILTCLPFVGFGLYYNEDTDKHFKCERYRNATNPVDIAYAYLYLVFGIFLSICLVWCNLSVIRALCHIGSTNKDNKMVVRRISRNSSKCKSLSKQNSSRSTGSNVSTTDEISFSRLMAVLSICFIICWLPNLVATFVFLIWKDVKYIKGLSNVADFLMLLNYTLDPYLYVLLRGLCPIPKRIRLAYNRNILRQKCPDHESMKMTGTNDGLTAVVDLTPRETSEEFQEWTWPPKLDNLNPKLELDSNRDSKEADKGIVDIGSKQSSKLLDEETAY